MDHIFHLTASTSPLPLVKNENPIISRQRNNLVECTPLFAWLSNNLPYHLLVTEYIIWLTTERDQRDSPALLLTKVWFFPNIKKLDRPNTLPFLGCYLFQFCFFCMWLFDETVRTADYNKASNIGWKWRGRNLEGSGWGLPEVPFWHMTVWSEYNYVKPARIAAVRPVYNWVPPAHNSEFCSYTNITSKLRWV